MKTYQLADMTKGWFVGDFEPTALSTQAAEMAYRSFRAGDREALHVHKVAAEVTVIVAGRARMNDKEYQAGDIITLEPNEAADFEALTDGATIVVKVPSVKGDKYLV